MKAKNQPKTDFQKMALQCAKQACDDNFESRRGVDLLEKERLVCVYNNNPYAQFPDHRDKELARFRELLTEHKLQEVGFATYPLSGEEAGYTFAILIDTDNDAIVSGLYKRALQETPVPDGTINNPYPPGTITDSCYDGMPAEVERAYMRGMEMAVSQLVQAAGNGPVELADLEAWASEIHEWRWSDKVRAWKQGERVKPTSPPDFSKVQSGTKAAA